MLIDRPWGVSAFGQGAASTEPDRAVISFAINRLASEPGQALADARTAAASVRRSLRGHGVSDEGVNSSRTKVHSVWEGHGPTRNLVGHQCRIEFAAELEALDTVEGCLVDLVAAGADEIVGVAYESSRRSELLAAARREAVEAARAKASLYAEAAEVTLGPVVHIEDVESRGPGPQLSRMAMAGGEADGDSLVPGSVGVDAAVIVGFSIAV